MADKITPEFLKTISDAITSASQANNHSRINQIAVPSYSGSSKEGAYSFVEKFEENTNQLDDHQRLQILPKFLTSIARTWYKFHIEPTGNSSTWKQVKQKFLNRFGGKDRAGYHLGKIRNMKFDEEANGVSDYVDEFLYHYSKAFPGTENNHLVQEVHRSLPSHLQADINRFHTIGEGTKISEYIQIIQDYDERVYSVAPKRKAINAIGDSNDLVERFTKALKPLVTEIVEDKIKSIPEDKTQTANDSEQIEETEEITENEVLYIRGRPYHPAKQQFPQYQRYAPRQFERTRQNIAHQPHYRQQNFQNDGTLRHYRQDRPALPNRYQQQTYTQLPQATAFKQVSYIGNQGQSNIQAHRGFTGCFRCGGSHYARDCYLNVQGRPQ